MKGSIRFGLYRRSSMLLSAAILIVAISVRLIPLGRYVTPDEPIWVMRSIRFLDAVRTRSWVEIPQTGHPGLTTMVIGAIGVRITGWLDPAGGRAHLNWVRNLAWLAPENAAAIRHLSAFLPAARILVAVSQSLGLVLVYGLGRSRLGERHARWLAVFLALDPFLIGHAGLLHTDALQATFVLLAVLFAMPARSTRNHRLLGHSVKNRRWLSIVLSGLCLALAGLTKLLGLLVAPGLAIALIVWGREHGIQRWLLVGLLALSTIGFGFALYPPFWVDPKAAIDILLNAVRYHEGLGLRDTFFAGRMTADPGPWFYPVVLLFRMTPIALIGLTLGILRLRPPFSGGMGWFLLPAIGYLSVLMVATKTFDRYALTPLVLLTAVAAVGWARDRMGEFKRQVLTAGLLLPWVVVAVVPLNYADPLLGGPWVARHLIPLGWGEGTGLAAGIIDQEASDDQVLLVENVPGAAPFFDGSLRPLKRTPIHCGDFVIGGLSSEYSDLLRRDTVNVAGLSLATLYTREKTAALVPSRLYLLPGPLPGFNEAAANVVVTPLTDTLHLYRWLSDQFGDVGEFVWVHAPACYPLTNAHIESVLKADDGLFDCRLIEDHSSFDTELCRFLDEKEEPASWTARFSQGLDLIAVSIPDSIQAPDALTVGMRWLPQISPGNIELYLALRDPETDLIWSEGGRAAVSDRGWQSSVWTLSQTVDTEAYIPIPRSLPPARYEVTLRVSRIEDGWLGITRTDGGFGGTELTLGEVEVLPPSHSADALGFPQDISVDAAGLWIVSAEMARDSVWSGDRLPFRLEVLRTGEDAPRSLSWALVCNENIRDEGDLRWSPGHFSDWPEDFRFELRYAPQLDPTLVSGTCEFKLIVGQATAISLGTLKIRARERTFTLPDAPQLTIDAQVGDFGKLVGADLSTDTLQVGEVVTITLYWKANSGTGEDYTVFVHLSDSDGTLWAQSDTQPAGGKAPTSSWITGQVIVDRHSLTLPTLAPTGVYALWVGMYDSEVGYRVPLERGGGRLPGDRVRVGDLRIR